MGRAARHYCTPFVDLSEALSRASRRPRRRLRVTVITPLAGRAEGRIGRRADDESRLSGFDHKVTCTYQEWLAERRAKRDAAEAVSLTDEKPQRRRK